MSRKKKDQRFYNKPVGKFKSKFERKLHRAMVAFGLSPSYEAEKINYVIESKYSPDFILEGNDRKIYIEAKGYFPRDQRRKMAAVKKSHPDIDIRIVFQKDSKLTKNGSATYADWATRHNFPYAFGKIPKEWLEEVKEDDKEV